MDQQVIDRLYDDLKIDQKPGQGFKYVKTRYVLDRLNKAFNCNWGLEIKEHKVIDDEVIHMYLMNPKAPCFIRDDEENYTYLILPVNISQNQNR